MTSSGILEVIVCSEPDAVAAVEGGADRLEVINHFEAGGLTPPLELVRRIAARVQVPLRVMLRHSEPFVVRDRGEIEDLCAAARAFASIGIDGLVLGFLQDSPDGQRIDHQLLTRVLACAPNVKATFHRAFEELSDPLGNRRIETVAKSRYQIANQGLVVHLHARTRYAVLGLERPASTPPRCAPWSACCASRVDCTSTCRRATCSAA